jgi:N-acetylmuramoyl-L-alanine amidase
MKRERAAALASFPSLIGRFLLSTVLAMAADVLPARATMITSTWIERRGDVVTVHVRLNGRPRWVLSRQSNRLQIDLPGTRLNMAPNEFLHAAAGPLGSVRIAPAANQSVRIQIDVTTGCDYVVGRRRNQLIVGLAPRGAPALHLADAFNSVPASPRARTAMARRAAPVAPAPLVDMTAPPAIAVPATGRAQLQPALATGAPVVVVDPGHGGHDPGTRSADGLLEKDLALQIGRRLADALAQRGIRPVMTRERDEYLTLAQRTAIANRSGAELFVSIHLNWSPNPRTAGVEVYYLNNTTDRATIRLARMENAAGDAAAARDSNLNYILSDLRQQYKATESALLAEVMEEQTVDALRAAFGDRLAALGAKRGPFYVLVGPKIPAVLVECGFLSNPAQAHRLANPQYQQVLANALAASVVHYLNQDVTAGTL